MKNFKFNALTTYANNMSKSHVIEFEYDNEVDTRSLSLLSVICESEHIHDCYLIDNDSKCNITFDFTIELKGGLFEETGKGYFSDYSCYTFTQLNNDINEIIKRPDFIRIVKQPFMRFHYSKSGKAIDYLAMHDIVKRPDNLFDGGLWFDSSLHFENIKDQFSRNNFNEVIF